MLTKENRNRNTDKYVSPVNWYLASYLHRFRVIDEKEDKPNNRHTTWGNSVLIKAKSPGLDYEKAIAQGKLGTEPYKTVDGKTVGFVFEGLTSLIAIIDELEDGAETIWEEQENKALKTIQGWVKKKEELEVLNR